MALYILPYCSAQKFPSVFQNSDLGLMYRFENENMKRTVVIDKPHKFQPIVLAINLKNNDGLEDDAEPIKIMPKPLSYLLFFKSLRSTATRFPRSDKLEIQTENTTPLMPNLQTYRYFMKQQPLFG